MKLKLGNTQVPLKCNLFGKRIEEKHRLQNDYSSQVFSFEFHACSHEIQTKNKQNDNEKIIK
jgi:hypothetical protein